MWERIYQFLVVLMVGVTVVVMWCLFNLYQIDAMYQALIEEFCK